MHGPDTCATHARDRHSGSVEHEEEPELETRTYVCITSDARAYLQGRNQWNDEKERRNETRGSARRRARPDRATVRQGLGDAHERPGAGGDRSGVDRLAVARYGARDRRPASRSRRGGVRPGVLREDDARLPRHRRGATARWDLCLHRRRARDGSAVRPQHRRRHRRAPRLPAGHRGAGTRDLRAARALGCRRRGRDRLGRGAHAEGRDRGRDGRQPRRPPGDGS